MHLRRFDIENFRSIKRASVGNVGRLTTLIGANNEGKSNILRALRLALSAMEDIQRFSISGQRVRVRQATLRSAESEVNYLWERDFPIDLQNKAGNKDFSTRVKLTFELTAEEIKDFTTQFGINVNGIIPVQLSFSRDEIEVDIIKQGPTKREFTSRRVAISRFLSQRLRFNYIPAIRTSEISSSIINRIAGQRLRHAFRQSLEEISEKLATVEQEVLAEIQSNLSETLGSYIPDIKSVRVETSLRTGFVPDLGTLRVLVNDGSETELSTKGDGVQSLAAIALMQANSSSHDGATIIAIEEPEAHLNSEAIYKVRSALVSSLGQNQVILTTHSPIFAYSGQIEANIIVKDSKANPAKKMSEIREALGVRVPENLTSAGLVLLCEGACDCCYVERILQQDKVLAHNLEAGFIKIENLQGAQGLLVAARSYKSLACDVVALLDGDNEGRDAAQRAIDASYIDAQSVIICADGVRNQAEFEDLLDPGAVKRILSDLHIEADDTFAAHGGKFSVRLENLLRRTGHLNLTEQIDAAKVYLQKESCKAEAIPFSPVGVQLSEGLRQKVLSRVTQL